MLAADAVRRAHAESLPQLLSAGLLRMYGLRVAGQFVAVFYGLADAAGSTTTWAGSTPRTSTLSPGTLLIGHAVEQAAAAGAEAFDFLKGREPYKYLWGAADTSDGFARRLTHPGGHGMRPLSRPLGRPVTRATVGPAGLAATRRVRAPAGCPLQLEQATGR